MRKDYKEEILQFQYCDYVYLLIDSPQPEGSQHKSNTQQRAQPIKIKISMGASQGPEEEKNNRQCDNGNKAVN